MIIIEIYFVLQIGKVGACVDLWLWLDYFTMRKKASQVETEGKAGRGKHPVFRTPLRIFIFFFAPFSNSTRTKTDCFVCKSVSIIQDVASRCLLMLGSPCGHTLTFRALARTLVSSTTVC